MAVACPECGASYPDPADSCTRRFNELLALDHSRQEPWGSRHGLAFAVFALQHPSRFSAATRARSFELLTRVYRAGEDAAFVTRDFRRSSAPQPGELSHAAVAVRHDVYPITIADLGAFDAPRYAALLDEWCLSTLMVLERGSGSGASVRSGAG